MRLTLNRESVGFLLVILVFAGLIAPPFALEVFGYQPHSLIMSGTPIHDTVFTVVASEEPDDAVNPGGIVQSSENSVWMVLDYSTMTRVNLSAAVDSALSFGSQFSYLESENLTLDEEWTRLDSTQWVLRFFGSSFEVYYSVNSFSGKVTGFQTKWQGPSPYVRTYNGSSPLERSSLEEIALNSLLHLNYSLSTDSMYVGPEILYDIGYISHYVHRLRFFHIINDTLVWGDCVTLALDLLTGEIVGFYYIWTDVVSLPIENAVNAFTAEETAVGFVRDSFNSSVTSVESSAMIFMNIQNNNATGYRLVWAVSVNHPLVGAVFLDAVSQDIITTMQNVVASQALTKNSIRFDLIVMIVTAPTIAAAAGFIIARRRIHHHLPTEDSGLEDESFE